MNRSSLSYQQRFNLLTNVRGFNLLKCGESEDGLKCEAWKNSSVDIERLDIGTGLRRGDS